MKAICGSVLCRRSVEEVLSESSKRFNDRRRWSRASDVSSGVGDQVWNRRTVLKTVESVNSCGALGFPSREHEVQSRLSSMKVNIRFRSDF